MKAIRRFLMLVVFFAALAAAHATSDSDYTSIAGYVDLPSETAGPRALAILRAHNIKSVIAGSLGFTISVPAGQALQALRLLAKAILVEKIDLTLFDANGDALTPESVLETK